VHGHEGDADGEQADDPVPRAILSREHWQEIFAHPLAKLMAGSLALLLLFIICGGGAASVQVR
jgi:hypothetical protein